MYNMVMTKGTTIKPLRDLLLIKLDEIAKQTKTGLYVEHGWEKTQSTATILAVGNDVKNFKKGDRVMINPYALLDVDSDGETYQFLREGDILARACL